MLQQGEKVGQPIILFRTANYDPALDWTVAFQGTVADFHAAGLVSAALSLHYGNWLHVRSRLTTRRSRSSTRRTAWTPVCAWAWPPPRFSGEGVTLQPCGVSANTVWIVDTYDSWSLFTNGGYIPLINGSDTNFSQPFVLTYPNSGFPTDKPRPQLTVTNLTGFSNGHGGPELGTVESNQLWGAASGSSARTLSSHASNQVTPVPA